MSKDLTESKVIAALDWAYEKAVNGVAGLDSAQEIAQGYKKPNQTPYEQANSLIRWQNAKAGTSGFITGLGGFLVMPVTIPANLASVMYVQIRMIAAIAHLGGYDLRDDKVKTLVYSCMAGNAAKDILKDVGIQIGKKVTQNAIKNISKSTITAINRRVGFRLLTKFGEKGVVNLGKAIPLLGGVIGATFDITSTNLIGNIARDAFTPKND
ncbi:EcsC family protein [Stenotrophomonas sp.]|uniref:EcsC family protein n=1 Tax=Stenotrophomonas sp. TaxID=69392 RepID=UPI0028B1B976|nr:EcsC family protein [Stenotrophomonas sp.]